MDEIDFLDEFCFDFAIINTIATCIPFLTAYFAFLIVRERASKFKKLQHICGISIKMYWIVNAAWDYATYIIYILVFAVSFIAIRSNGFNGDVVMMIFTFLLLYGISGIAFVYILSYLFKDEFFAFTTTTVINLVLGACNFGLIERLLKNYYKLKLFFMVFPQFAIVDAIFLILHHGSIIKLCDDALPLYDNITLLCQEEYMCCGKFPMF